MPLKKALASDTATLLAWTDPRPYEAGFMGSRPYPAGVSMRVVFGTDEHGFAILKVKTDDIAAVMEGLDGATRGIEVEITYEEGRNGEAGRLHSLKRSAKVSAVPPPARAAS